MESGDTALFINSINVGEAFYIIARARRIQAADYFLKVGHRSDVYKL